MVPAHILSSEREAKVKTCKQHQKFVTFPRQIGVQTPVISWGWAVEGKARSLEVTVRALRTANQRNDSGHGIIKDFVQVEHEGNGGLLKERARS